MEKESMQGSLKINRRLSSLPLTCSVRSGTSCPARLALDFFSGSGFNLALFFFLSFAGVQPGGAGEQERSRVQEEGGHPAQREADL